jgi:hypothetical protein
MIKPFSNQNINYDRVKKEKLEYNNHIFIY